MATNGSIAINGSGWNSTFSWSLDRQDIADNYSVINWWYDNNWGSNQWVWSNRCRLWFDGVEIYSRGSTNARGGRVSSGQKTLWHNNSTGVRGFAMAGEAAFYQAGINARGNGYWDLPIIPRHGTITNTSGNFDDENYSPWIDFANIAGGRTEVWFELPDLTGTTRYCHRHNINSRYTWTITESEMDLLRQKLANVSQTKIRYVYSNYVGGSWKSTWRDSTFTIKNANPTFTDFTWVDKNTATNTITGDNKIAISERSQIDVIISSANKAVAKKHASIRKYRVVIGTTEKLVEYSENDITVSMGEINAEDILVEAIDSRNKKVAITKKITVIPYTAPTLVASLERKNQFENETTLKISGEYSPIIINGLTKNSIDANSGLEYRYKSTSTTTWGNWTKKPCAMSNEKIVVTNTLLDLNNQQAFDFEIRVRDKLATTTVAIRVEVGNPPFYIGVDGRISIGGMPTRSLDSGMRGQLEVFGNIYSNGSRLGPATYQEIEKALWENGAWVKANSLELSSNVNVSQYFLEIPIPSKYQSIDPKIVEYQIFTSIEVLKSINEARWVKMQVKCDNNWITEYSQSYIRSGGDGDFNKVQHYVNSNHDFFGLEFVAMTTWDSFSAQAFISHPNNSNHWTITATAGGHSRDNGLSFIGGARTKTAAPITAVRFMLNGGGVTVVKGSRIAIFARKVL